MSAISANVPNIASWTSLVVQWRVICLPVQGAWVQSLVQEDSICCEAVSLCATTTEPLCHKRNLHDEKLLHCNEDPVQPKKKNVACFICMSEVSHLLTPTELKNIYNLKVKSYILFGRNFEDFKLGRQHINLSNLALFCVGRCKNLGSQISFPQYVPQLRGSLYPISQVSSGLTTGCGCSLMAARCQAFFSWSFLRTHQLTLEGYEH